MHRDQLANQHVPNLDSKEGDGELQEVARSQKMERKWGKKGEKGEKEKVLLKSFNVEFSAFQTTWGKRSEVLGGFFAQNKNT